MLWLPVRNSHFHSSRRPRCRTAWASHVREGARVFTFALTGEAECNAAGTACDLGDEDGTGTLTLYVNPVRSGSATT